MHASGRSRAALWCAVAALGAALGSLALVLVLLTQPAASAYSWVGTTLQVMLVPVLTVAALAAQLEAHGVLGGARRRGILALTAGASLAASGVTSTWLASFRPPGDAWVISALPGPALGAAFVVAWVAAGIALALLGDAAWRPSYLDARARRTLVTLTGAVAPPILGGLVLLPWGAVMLAGGALAVVLVARSASAARLDGAQA